MTKNSIPADALEKLKQCDKIYLENYTVNFPYPGHLLLCSDGLWGEVEEDDILEIVNQAPNPQYASYKLVEAAINNGGGDNIAIVLTAMKEQNKR